MSRRPLLLALAAATLLAGVYYALAVQRVNGDLLNSYPLGLMDGYDWLLEGHAVAAMLGGHRDVDLPLLRNPIYVLCAAADAALGGVGRFLFAIHALAFLAQAALLMLAARQLGTDRRLVPWLPALLATSALGAYRFAIYPDDIALVAVLGSVLALLAWRRSGSRAALVVLGGATVLGALTQEYVLIPLLVGTIFYSAVSLRRKEPLPRSLILTCGLACGVYLAASHAWHRVVPHRYERDVWAPFFDTTRSHAEVAGANAVLWLHTFWPLAGVFVIAALSWRRDRGRESREPALLVGSILLAFALLTMLYRWEDARYTYVLVPLVLLLCCALMSNAAGRDERSAWLRWAGAPLIAVALWAAQGLGVWRPFDRWVPGGGRVSLPAVLALPTVDRFGLEERCGSPSAFCAAAEVPPRLAPYPRVVLCEYRSLRVNGQMGGCGELREVPNMKPVAHAISR